MGGSLIGDTLRGARVLAVLAVLLAGCAKHLPTGEVSGSITYNGQALPSGTVAFYGEDGRVDSSLIASDGGYSIGNAPCGQVRITVQTPPLAKGRFAGMSIPTIEIPKQYSQPEASGLMFRVVPGEQSFDIKLTGPPVRDNTAARSIDIDLKMKMKGKQE
jgi:hypothetical protein